MRGLLITNDFPPMGGGEATYYARLCAAAAGRAVVLAPRLPGDRTFDARQAYPVIRRWVPLSPHPAARLVQMGLLLLYAIPTVARKRIDVVHIGHLYLGPIALALRVLLGRPYVLYLHGGEMAPYMRRGLVRAAVRAVVERADVVVVNSTYTRRHFEGLGIRHPRVVLLASGVPLDRFRPGRDAGAARARYGLDGGRVILTVGRLVARKGQDVVIRALDRVRREVGPLRYVIAGGGPEEPRLRALARDLGVEEHVRFLGHVPGDELPSLYAAADVFVMPSRVLPERDGIEGFGIAYVEAGACGKPVIGGRSGGVEDAVAEGITGLLVDPTDPDAVAGALVRLLRDPGEAARLGRNGRRRAEQLEAAWTEAVTHIWPLGRTEGWRRGA